MSLKSDLKAALFPENRPAHPTVEAALALMYAMTGRGGAFLEFRREYHRRRADLERAFLSHASLENGELVVNRCPACGNERGDDAFYNPVGFRFVRCSKCRTIYMDPVPSSAALARLYNDPAETFHWQKGESTVGTVKPAHEERDALLRMMPSVARGSLLDVGCAVGAFLLSAKEQFDRVEGVELNANTAATARSNGFEVTTGRLEDVAPGKRFDVITMLQVIEHIVQPAETLERVRAMLTQGGIFYFSLPAVDTASFKYLQRDHVHVSSYGHVSLFSREGLESLARRTGFRVAAHEFYGGLDVSLHDVVSRRIMPGQFRHRMAAYNSRLLFSSNFVEKVLPERAVKALLPAGEQSYQRVIFSPA
ncbi:MAG: class I SAM-dependent methyltransferase [Archangiaceae bacterium]|nr:class I SAM-dependent methyltransferase [Archangiaceae bacterium]